MLKVDPHLEPITAAPAEALRLEAKPLGDEEVYALPATQGQVRFWSLDRLNPGNPALNMPLMWQCTGVLHQDIMARAFAACVDRHESLRTTFALSEGTLVQVIHPRMAMPVPVIDLSTLTGEAQRIQADQLTRAHAALRMDLKQGPLLALQLLKLGEQRHLLLVTMHHIICDGISNGILMRDMVAFYEAFLHGTTPDLPVLPIQFADHAVWQEQWRASQEPAESLAFWRKTLGNDFAPVDLPRDSDASSSLSEDRTQLTGDIETLLIQRDLAARAHAFCIRENVTFNMLLFSVFTALLSRLTGQHDLTIGSPCANRTEDTQDLIGLFMNIQVMRAKLTPESTFRDLLGKIQAWTLGAYDHQTLPFEDLIHDPFFSQDGNPFELPVFFLYQKSFMLISRTQDKEGNSLEIIPLRSESPGAVFEIMFAIVDREEEGPRLQLEYNPHTFKSSTIQRYLRCYLNLLESAITNQDQLVETLAILSASEQHKLLTQTNETAIDFGPFKPVHRAFLERAQANPERVALRCGGAAWSAGQLLTYSTSLAQRLIAEGLQPGSLTGVCLSRSPEMVGAVLAVLMAGGAYVPLDPRHPRERLEMILANSAAGLLLVDQDHHFHSSAKLIELHKPAPTPVATALPEQTLPDSLAYVIYTSGSTGKPKGVAIGHGALMNLLLSMQRVPGLSAEDVLVAVTTLAFDIAALELFLPLLTDALLVLATDAEVQNPPLLLSLLEESKATVLQATPGAWRVLIDQGWTDALPLKALCGGEALSRDLAEKLLDRTPRVWNVYGPTETTIWSSATLVTRGTDLPHIGPPIANTQFYILDKRSQPVPVGIAGELAIGGAGLASGYWNLPELTATKFVPNPFGPGRLYRTGDLARWHEDGSVQLLGRADFQVKVRGFRIELGEIENVLTQNSRVREAVVVQHVIEEAPGVTGITRLIAYCDVGPDMTDDAINQLILDLEATLSKALPDYMTPNAIMALKQMPRTPNGKLDRRALPDVFAQAGDSGIRVRDAETLTFLEPQDTIDRQLTEIWQTTLGIPRISMRASFFSLGVGSLAALRLIARMNRVYAMDLGLASLISASTIESISELIRNRFAPNTSSSLVPIQPNGTKPPLFIVHGVGGNVVNFYGLSMRMGPHQPVYGIQSQALVANQAALLHLKDMASHYLREIRQVQPNGPYHLLGYSFGGTVVLEMAHQLRAAGEEVAMLGMLDSKSKDYEEELQKSTPVQSKIERRVHRFRGNTTNLSWKQRAAYLLEKFSTRSIRFTVMAAAYFKFTKVPAFMKSAYDINYVAVQNYKLLPYDGRLILFRASEQTDQRGPRDFGWSSIFKGGVEIHDLPGDHERIFLDPNIDVLASSLRASLRNV